MNSIVYDFNSQEYWEFMLKMLERYENNDLIKVEEKAFLKKWENEKKRLWTKIDIVVINYLEILANKV